VRQHQHLSYKDRWSVTDIGDYPRLDALTRAYDLDYVKLESDREIHEKIQEFLQCENSVLLEVDVDPDWMAFGDFHKEYHR
jgi:acetolactate synthase-1/2/3 large subunit